MAEKRLIGITLDPGHAKDYNKGAVPGYYESNAMYDLSLYLKEELERYNIFQVYNTKSKLDCCPSLTERGTFAINNHSRCFISLHTNGANGAATGTEIYASIKTDSNSFAAKMAKKIVSVLLDNGDIKAHFRSVIQKKNSAGNDYYGVLRSSTASKGVMDSFLIEHCFHDNYTECAVIAQTDVLKKLAAEEAAIIYERYKSYYINDNVTTYDRILTANVNIRSVPNTSSTILGLGPKDSTVQVISVDGSWATILYHGCAAFVAATYIDRITGIPTNAKCGNTLPKITPKVDYSTFAPPEETFYLGYCTITGNGVNLRVGPGTQYKVIGSLNKGQKEKFYKDLDVEYSDKWLRIVLDGDVHGYVSSDYVNFIDTSEYTEADTTASILNLRSAPAIISSPSNVVNQAPRGTRVYAKTVKDSDKSSWSEVYLKSEVDAFKNATESKYPTRYYVSSKYLKFFNTSIEAETEPIIPFGLGYTSTALNVRSGPGITYAKISTLAKGTYVVIVEAIEESEFIKVLSNGGYDGYVSSRYVLDILDIGEDLKIKLSEQGKIYAEEVWQQDPVTFFTHTLNAKVTSPFGLRTDPITGKSNVTHSGIDFATAKGMPIYSPIDGIVNYSGYDASGFGHYCSIMAKDGTKHYFAHMEKAPSVNAGDPIAAGVILGYVGATGKATGNHLHYGIKDLKGNYFNPEGYDYQKTINKA